MPTFEYFLRPPPTLEHHLTEETLKLAPEYAFTYTKAAMSNMVPDMMATATRVDLKFTSDHLKAIRVSARRNASSDVNISTQDSLAAYLVKALNQVLPTPIERVSYVVNVRNFLLYPGN